MDDQQAAALEGAADAEVVAETGQIEDQAEGQVEGQPEGEEEPGKTKSQRRREAREAAARMAREEAEEAGRKLREAEAKLAKLKSAADGSKEPREADFDDPIVYAAARAVWLSKAEDRRGLENETAQEIEENRRRQDAAEQRRIAALAKDFGDGITEAKAKYADFDAVVAVAQDASVVSPDLALMVLDSDAPHDLAYHLGKNPSEARRLSQLPLHMAARELGRIEARLTAPRARTETTAPEPYTPVRGRASAVKSVDSMTMDEYRAAREAGKLK
jgi:hypothetical protein